MSLTRFSRFPSLAALPKLSVAALSLLLAAAGATGATAQTVASAGSQAAAPAGPSELDLAALRYFLSIGDQALADDERDRLARAFPGVDVDGIVEGIALGGSVDTGPVWRLIDESRYPEARAMIDTLQTETPAWAPDAKLLEVLTLREGQARLEVLLAETNVPDALALGQTTPSLFECARINNAWRLAEAAARAGDPDLAVEIYANTLRACAAPEHVTATLQKLRLHADADTMRGLYDEAALRYPTLAPQIAALEAETFVAEAEVAAPTATTPARPAVTALSRAQSAAARGDAFSCVAALGAGQSSAASLQRGWCLHDLGRHASAAAAFRDAAERGTNTQRNEATYGLSLTLAAAGDVENAVAALRATQVEAPRQRVAARTVHSAAATEAFEQGDNREAVAHLERVETSGSALDRGQLMLKGWALHREGRMLEARRAFRAADRISSGTDSRLALSKSR